MACFDMKSGLDSVEIIRRIEERRDEIGKFGVKRLGLFGSYLKGTQKRGSDVDILVEFDKVTFSGYFSFLRLLRKMFHRKVDLIIEKDLKSELDYVREDAIYVKI